jgi:hypothetical protein
MYFSSKVNSAAGSRSKEMILRWKIHVNKNVLEFLFNTARTYLYIKSEKRKLVFPTAK